MTCIVGMIDKKKECVWIGCDSQVTGGDFVNVLPEDYKKIGRIGGYDNTLFGVSGLPRTIDLFLYNKALLNELDLLKNVNMNHEYLCRNFVPRFQEMIKKEKENNPNYYYYQTIIGIKDKMFLLESNSSLIPYKNYVCTGSGFELASAVCVDNYEDNKKSYAQKIEEALVVAEKHNDGVCRPFYIMNTLNDEIIKID